MVRVIAQDQMYVCNCPNDFIEKEHSTCTRYKGLREKFMCMKQKKSGFVTCFT